MKGINKFISKTNNKYIDNIFIDDDDIFILINDIGIVIPMYILIKHSDSYS